MSVLDLELAVLAGCMAVVTAFLVRWAAEAPDRLGQGVVLFLLVMMTSMSGAGALYFSAPSTASLVEAAALAGGLMLVAAACVFLLFLRESKARPTEDDGGKGSSRSAPRSWLFLGSVVGLVLLGEFLMGWAFQLASAPGSLPTVDATTFASSVVNSPWFLFTMSAEMGLTTFLLRAKLGTAFLPVVGLQAAIMFLSPTALPSWTLVNTTRTLYGVTLVPYSVGTFTLPITIMWASLAIVLSSVAMIVLFVYQMEYIYRHPELPRGLGRYLVLLVGVYGVMMAGLYVWFVYADARLFAASVLLEMVLYLGAVVSPSNLTSDEDRFNWQLNPRWAFALLSGIFVAEFFMGALLDLVIEPQTYGGIASALPLSGSSATILSNAVTNGFWFIAAVAGSSWFLIMMGAEMGALVAFKFRESKNAENRFRLALMMASYTAFVLFFPSVYYTYLFTSQGWQGTNVPVLGWSMGIGSAPIGPSVFLVIAATYAIMGVFCFLFGRRVICSVFCSAPFMYQGTAIDSMSTFNRHSWPAKKYLGSKLSNLYTATTGVVMGSLVLAAFVSYYDTLGVLNVYVDGADPTVFLFALWFSVVWYLMFVTIPYTGNYNCVTMGWCYTGTIAQAFQKLGPYKLKVHSKQVCRDCTTLDCAKACPVGLVDMPGFFRTRGEYRSSKCCGVGNCVGVCPYGNLYIYDIRHWVLERTGHAPRVPKGHPLKVLSDKPAPPSSAPPGVSVAEAAPTPP